MMRSIACALALAVVGLSTLGAQDKKTSAKETPKTISLSGCVVRGEKAPEQYTLDDATEGKYRLTGLNLRDYIGKRVQIAGGIVETKRLTIKGGLTPNANVAGQAGAMDPARAAVAAAGGAAGPGTVDLPEFKVKSVRPVSGGCSD
jgi:hypothetical protein